jgi:hypothetical protein
MAARDGFNGTAGPRRLAIELGNEQFDEIHPASLSHRRT